MFGLGKKKTVAAEDLAQDTGPARRLFVHVRESSWQARIVDRQGAAVDQFAGTAEDGAGTASDRRERTVADVAKALTKSRLAEVGEINILHDDPDGMVIDAKEDVFAAAAPTPAGIRLHGARLMNCDEVTFGGCPFGPARPGDDGPRPGAYAYADADIVRNDLGLLESNALLVTSFVPAATLLVGRAAAAADETYAGLYVADWASYLVVGNRVQGTLTSRVIPVGLMTLVDAVSRHSSVSKKEALDSLGKRDHISSIEVKGKKDQNSILVGPYDKVLAPLLGELVGQIERTVGFFDEQRMSGRPGRLEVLGDLTVIKGFDQLLNKELAFPIAAEKAALLDLFVATPFEARANLLGGADGSLVTVGKMDYTFSRDKLVSADELALAEERAAVKEAADQSAATPSAPSARRTKEKKKKAGAAGKGGGLMAFLNQPIGGAKGSGKKKAAAARPAAGEGAAKLKRQEQAYFAVFGFLVFGIVYYGWMNYQDVAGRADAAASGVSRQLRENTALRKEVVDSSTFRAVASAADIDKVLWSEKFLSIADNMDNAMWLTDLYLVDEVRKIGDATVKSKKLTMEGAVLPSTVGHILEISKFINRLLNDEATFMSDFRDITFAGAHIDETEADHVVRFVVDAWYDENKRVEALDAQKMEPGKASIGDVQKLDKQRKQTLDDVVSGNIGSDNNEQ